ncbi:MAG: tRNA epoxyqueuosine(34) reductase QueG [Prevotella sp.]
MNGGVSLAHIVQAALRLGFSACGIAPAHEVAPEVSTAYRRWIIKGCHAEMSYLAQHLDKRFSPSLLVPGTQSIVSVALNYYPPQRIPATAYQIATYALGDDYHDVMKEKLHQLQESIGGLRSFCDTAPVLERYWAVQAGLGWIGKNHQLIIPGAGSHFFLGEVFLPYPLPQYSKPVTERCGTCDACVRACPAAALQMGDTYSFDAEKCLSYQTIEYRGTTLTPQVTASMGSRIYGCDCCQDACPWNRFASPTAEPRLQPRPALLAMTKEAWHQLSPEQYRQLLKGSAMKRTKYDMLMRNIHAATNNNE